MASIQAGVNHEERRVPEIAVPSYLELGGDRVRATFPADETSLELVRARERSYPGLFGPAPRTDSIYRALAGAARERHVLDLGCGSGAGLARLEGARSRVGVDLAEEAILFASRAVSGATFLCQDATESKLARADFITIVDVLGCIQTPAALLRSARASLRDGGTLFVAEPRASIAQELMSPARWAFSKPGLTALLAEAGFHVEAWVNEGRFWVVEASGVESPWQHGLDRAHRAISDGKLREASALLARQPEVPGGVLEASWALLLADVCGRLGDADAALQTLMRGHERAPDDARILAELAELLARHGEFAEAVRFGSAAIERDPADPQAVRAMARALAPASAPEQRVVLWQKALRLDPSSLDLSVRLAVAASEIGCYSIGTTALEKVRDYGGSLPADFHLTLGWLYLMMGRRDEAQVEAQLAALVEPAHPGTMDLKLAICESNPSPLGRA